MESVRISSIIFLMVFFAALHVINGQTYFEPVNKND